MKVTHKKPVTDFEYNKRKNSQQKDVDRILDKISKKNLIISKKKLNKFKNLESVFTPNLPTYNLNCLFSDFESDLTN